MADHSYDTQALVYITQGASELHVASGGKLVIETGATFSNQGASSPAAVTFTPVAGGTTGLCVVTIQVNDGSGAAITYPVVMTLWLSDNANGTGLTAQTASGTVVNSGTSGVDFGTIVSKKALTVQTSATGAYTLGVTDTVHNAFVPCVEIGGRSYVGAALVPGNYT